MLYNMLESQHQKCYTLCEAEINAERRSIMTDSFKNSDWIWYTKDERPDTHGDFKDSFEYTGGKVLCRISCDGDYVLFVNGRLAGSNQYGDFEHYKIYDSIDITDYLHKGSNTVDITVWHLGINSSRCKAATAGLLYEIECDSTVLCRSCEETLSRQNPYYKAEYCKMITSQLGQSFLYDSSAEEAPYGKSVLAEKHCEMYIRPTERLSLSKKCEYTLIKAEPAHYLIDLGRETVGLPVLEFFSETVQKITACWGEHINGGGVSRIIGGRDFSFEYIATAGENSFTEYMLRIGCRYIELFCEAPIALHYAGIIPQFYPVEPVPKFFDDEIEQKIYDASVNTLRLCLMEHYVDTPWREQSLYAFDARNQMLCGYKAFKNRNSRYARASLVLISHDSRPDGLLSITYPCGTELAIPSFSLHYITAVREYADNTGDLSLVREVYPKLSELISTFKNQLRDGLPVKFSGSEYWNFYDWSPTNEGHLGKASSPEPDLILGCLFLIALKSFKYLSEKIGEEFKADSLIAELTARLKQSFYRAESGLFAMTFGGNEFTELGNSLAVLSELTDTAQAEKIAEALVSGKLEECTLSMKCFKYDALLKISPRFREHIVKEICDTYAPMLNGGTGTVWEVKEGASAFGNAGSLCHGWSAVPILYL